MTKTWQYSAVSLFMLLSQACVAATHVNFDHYFKNKTGCFLLFDQTHGKLIEHYNPKQCATRMAANSTFKIPLSVMAFDQHVITQHTRFKWDGQKRFLPQWNHDQDPHTWLQYSVVWVSQELTPKLGVSKIEHYLKDFAYGNADFSGNPGKHDGLSQAWLSSSLQLSADEQLAFLQHFFSESLPVSKPSIQQTKHNIYLQSSPQGWKLYGKTGTGHNAQGQDTGWFVGCVEKGSQRYIFVTNFINDRMAKLESAGGPVAKKLVLSVLREKKLY